MTLALLLGLAAPAHAQASVHHFTLGGSAEVVSEDCIRLTPDEPYQTGSAWFEQALDLSHPFELRFTLLLGDKDAQGADGIVFVLHPRPETGWRGEGMGFAGLVPSLGVEFDTYRNHHLGDPASDHVAVMRDGRSYHTTDPAEVRELEDGQQHPLRVVYDPALGLEVHLDGRRKASVPPATVRDIFGPVGQVHWGVTAGTGRLSNRQLVCLPTERLG